MTARDGTVLPRLVILGAAGQARELAAYVDAINGVRPTFELLGFVVTDLGRVGPRDSHARILGDLAWLDANAHRVDALALGVGKPAVRERLADECRRRYPSMAWPAIVAPSANLDPSVRVAEGVLVGAGAIATVNVVLDAFAMLNFGCTVGHEARIGRGSVVNPGANISGGVVVGDGALVGAGAVVLQYRSIGRGATVGAGAVVTRDVPDATTVVGTPARAVRPRPAHE